MQHGGGTYAVKPLDTDWTQIAAIIRGLSDPDAAAWRDRYSTPEQRAWLDERAAQASPTLIWESAKAWEAVYADFGALRRVNGVGGEVNLIRDSLKLC